MTAKARNLECRISNNTKHKASSKASPNDMAVARCVVLSLWDHEELLQHYRHFGPDGCI